MVSYRDMKEAGSAAVTAVGLERAKSIVANIGGAGELQNVPAENYERLHAALRNTAEARTASERDFLTVSAALRRLQETPCTSCDLQMALCQPGDDCNKTVAKVGWAALARLKDYF